MFDPQSQLAAEAFGGFAAGHGRQVIAGVCHFDQLMSTVEVIQHQLLPVQVAVLPFIFREPLAEGTLDVIRLEAIHSPDLHCDGELAQSV